MEITGTLEKREIQSQTLDQMDLERERGITIKLTPVRMEWKGIELNLIDTPWHVDFQYEVSRSLASVEWAILVVDATQGIEAQTLSNVYLAIENELAIIPVLNKIDLPSADVDRVSREVVDLLGCRREDIIPISAKTGENVVIILDRVIEKIPEPKELSTLSEPLPHGSILASKESVKALIFDSHYDPYKWVVVYLKVFSGSLMKGRSYEFINTCAKIEALEVWYFRPKYTPCGTLGPWEIGYLVTGLKSLTDAKVWDTLFSWPIESRHAIPWFSHISPFIFAGVFPVETDEYPKMKESIEKLVMNDAALVVEPEVSPALGYWFRCGFLGLLHLDIVKERLWREYGLDVIVTSPQVTYRVLLTGDKQDAYPRSRPELLTWEGVECTCIYLANPEELPKPWMFIHIEEPIWKVEIITPSMYIGNLMKLAQERRGIFRTQHYIDPERVILHYEIPMSELVGDFYDDLKSVSSGYASLSYEFLRYSPEDIVRLDVKVAGEVIEAFSTLIHRERARLIGGRICMKLKESIPREQFAVVIQAVIWTDVVAREDLSAMRKDVTAKLYWGDITRKKKLLEKQKEWKKKMKQFGRVSIPSEVFINILKK